MGERGEAPAALPAGTVTFLFTDLEGSTALLEAHPTAYRAAVRRHHALLRAAVEAHGGAVFETVGDAVYAAFAAPTDAVAAAIAGQLALQREDWGEVGVGALRARMGLHTGEAERQGGHYFGAPLYRCARLTATAHGGQTVLSEAAVALVRDALPARAGLLDLGEYRLKDLHRPERVFQLTAPGLPGDFPPLRTLDALPNNLPLQLTSFVGRERELAEVAALLGTQRLVTLTGPGGVGKTRLALQAAADALEAYPDGVWLVELAALADAALVPGAVAHAAGVRAAPGRPLLETLTDALRTRHLLLLLDNCEHLVEACARLADALLRACPHLTVLATSREALGLTGETTWRVPSLALPPPPAAAGPRPAAALGHAAAVRLFTDRARAALPAFRLTDANAPAVARLCTRLDGIPLALELAAARVTGLSVAQLAARLDDRFRLLTGGSRAALPRQQTLRATVDWSYALLTAPERALFARLAAFAGGFDLEAAEAVGAGDGIEPEGVLEVLLRLVDQSLVLADEAPGGAERYRLLETLRQYAQERLEGAGETAAVRGRHVAHFLALAEAAAPELFGPQQLRWSERLDADHDNLRAALRWAVAAGRADPALRLGAALWRFWEARGYRREGLRHLRDVLALPGAAAPSPARAAVLYGAAVVLMPGPDRAAARPLLEEGLATARAAGDGRGAGRALVVLGVLADEAGDHAAAGRHLDAGLAAARAAGDHYAAGMALRALGQRARAAGEYVRARALLEESLAVHRAARDPSMVASALGHLAHLDRAEGDPAAARPRYEEALALGRQLGQGWRVAAALTGLAGVAWAAGELPAARRALEEALAIARALGGQSEDEALLLLGRVAQAEGHHGEAQTHYARSLTLRRERGHRAALPEALEAVAGLAAARGHPARGSRLAGAAAALRVAVGVALTPAERAPLERTLAAVCRALGARGFGIAWAAGQTMPLEQAVADALAEESPEDPPAAA